MQVLTLTYIKIGFGIGRSASFSLDKLYANKTDSGSAQHGMNLCAN